jgi:hypothetical protein
MSNGSVPNIALRAYQLWDAGRPEGRDEEFYFQAEEELRKLMEGEDLDEAGAKRSTPMADTFATPENRGRNWQTDSATSQGRWRRRE